MKTLGTASIRCSLIFLLPLVAYAGSATWDLNPTSGNWNTAANWTPMTVPSDTATFALSNTTNVSVGFPGVGIDNITFTSAAANSFAITVHGSSTVFNIVGAGITNNSGIIQNFVIKPNSYIVFTNSAAAGSLTHFTNKGITDFFDSSSADNSMFVNDGGATFFLGRSTAGSATFINAGGVTFFLKDSSAGNGTFINNGGRVAGAGGAGTFFGGFRFPTESSAGNGTFINNGGRVAGAGGGFTHFDQNSTADSCTLIANGGSNGGDGGMIAFRDRSVGDISRVELFGNGSLDISAHDAPGVTIGSVEGDGNVFLGANTLTVGSNNLSTTFSGVIQNGAFGSGGSLTKIGLGTLILSGANTYTGGTKINGGVLQVDGSITSNTFVNYHGTLAGTGTINGNVVNRGKVMPGDAPGTLTINGDYTQAHSGTLLIDIAGTSAGQFSVLDVLGNANLDGFLDPVLLNGFFPSVGDSFTFLNYGSVSGSLFIHIHDPNIDGLAEHWVVNYLPDHALLIVVPGNVSVPDQGSALFLMVLSLLAVAVYRRSGALAPSAHMSP